MMWYWFNQEWLVLFECFICLCAIFAYLFPSKYPYPAPPPPPRPKPPQGSGGQSMKNYLEAMKIVQQAGVTVKEASAALSVASGIPMMQSEIDFIQEWCEKEIEDKDERQPLRCT